MDHKLLGHTNFLNSCILSMCYTTPFILTTTPVFNIIFELINYFQAILNYQQIGIIRTKYTFKNKCTKFYYFSF